MSTFDAGAIESRLILDRSDFTKGIRAAREQARRLDGLEIDIMLNLKGIDELVALQSMIEGADGQEVKIQAEVDREKAYADLTALITELNGIANTNPIDINVKVSGDAMAMAQLQALEMQANDLDNDIVTMYVRTVGNDGKAINGQNLGQRHLDGWRILLYSAVALLPVLGAAGGAAAGGIAGLSAALIGAVAATGILGVGLAVVISRMQEWKEMGEEAPASYLAFMKVLEDLNKVLDDFAEAIAPATFSMLTEGVGVLTTLLPQLVPVFNSIAGVARLMLMDLNEYFQSDDWAETLGWIGTFGAEAFSKILRIGANLIDFLFELGIAFEPLARMMLDGLERITAGWAGWAESLQGTEELQNFMDWVAERGGQVLDLLVAIGGAFINLGIALDPIAGPMLDILINFFEGIANMDPSQLGILAGAFIAFFTAMKLGVPLLMGIANGGGLVGLLGLTGLSAGALALAAFGAALGGIVAYLTLTTDTGEPFRKMWESLDGLWAQLKETGAAIWQILVDLVGVLQDSGAIANFQEVISILADTFTQLLPLLEPIVALLGLGVVAALAGMSAALRIAAEAFQFFADPILGVVNRIVDLFMWLYDILLGNSIIPDIVNGIVEWFGRLPGMAGAVVMAFVNFIIGLFTRLWNGAVNIFQAMASAVLGRVQAMTSGATSRWNAFVGWFSGLRGRFTGMVAGWFANVVTRAQSIISNVKGKWNDLIGWFGGMKSKITSKVSGMWDGIGSAFKAVINRIIGWWNRLSFSLNIPDAIPGLPNSFTISTPNVPYLAKGGYITGPTLAVVGEGSEPEVVAPLSELYRMLDREREISINQPEAKSASFDDALSVALIAAAIDELIEEIRRYGLGVNIDYKDYGQRRDVNSVAEDLWFKLRERV